MIIDLELAKLFARVQDLGYLIKLTDKAKDYIADKGYDHKFGARPLKRAIQKYLEDPLADEIINSNVGEGDSLSVDYSKKDDKIVVKVKKAKVPPAETAKKTDGDDDNSPDDKKSAE